MSNTSERSRKLDKDVLSWFPTRPPLREKALLRSHGVAVSSPPSHGGRTGSNPVGTIFLDSSEVIFSQCAKNVLNLQAFSRFSSVISIGNSGLLLKSMAA